MQYRICCVLNFKKETKDQHKKIMHKILWVVEMLILRRKKNHKHTYIHVHSECKKKMQHQPKKECTMHIQPKSKQFTNSMCEFLFLPEFSDPTHYFAVPFPLRIRCVLLLFLLIWMCFYFSMSSPFSGVGLSCVRNRIRRRKKTRRKPAPNQQTQIVLCMTDFVDVCFPSRLLVLLCVCFVIFFLFLFIRFCFLFE